VEYFQFSCRHVNLSKQLDVWLMIRGGTRKLKTTTFKCSKQATRQTMVLAKMINLIDVSIDCMSVFIETNYDSIALILDSIVYVATLFVKLIDFVEINIFNELFINKISFLFKLDLYKFVRDQIFLIVQIFCSLKFYFLLLAMAFVYLLAVLIRTRIVLNDHNNPNTNNDPLTMTTLTDTNDDEQNSNSQDDHLQNFCCTICKINMRNIVLLPCKHLCVCDGCYTYGRKNSCLYRCPLCRTTIIDSMKVFN
jgi:hypothetical protein